MKKGKHLVSKEEKKLFKGNKDQVEDASQYRKKQIEFWPKRYRAISVKPHEPTDVNWIGLAAVRPTASVMVSEKLQVGKDSTENVKKCALMWEHDETVFEFIKFGIDDDGDLDIDGIEPTEDEKKKAATFHSKALLFPDKEPRLKHRLTTWERSQVIDQGVLSEMEKMTDDIMMAARIAAHFLDSFERS